MDTKTEKEKSKSWTLLISTYFDDDNNNGNNDDLPSYQRNVQMHHFRNIEQNNLWCHKN